MPIFLSFYFCSLYLSCFLLFCFHFNTFVFGPFYFTQGTKFFKGSIFPCSLQLLKRKRFDNGIKKKGENCNCNKKPPSSLLSQTVLFYSFSGDCSLKSCLQVEQNTQKRVYVLHICRRNGYPRTFEGYIEH